MLKRSDWEELKKNAEGQLKIAEIAKMQFECLLKLAEEELKKWPKETKKKKPEFTG